MSHCWKDILSKLDGVYRTSKLLILIIPCLISSSVNSRNVTLTSAVSSNDGCEEEILLTYVHALFARDIRIHLRFNNVTTLPLNTSDLTTEPSFISAVASGSASLYHRGHYGGYYGSWLGCYARGEIVLNTTIVSVSQGKLKADIFMAKFENLLNITLPYNRTTTSGDKVSYIYEIRKNEYPIQKFRDAFLEHKPSQGFNKIITPTLLERAQAISFSLEKETSNLTSETEVDIKYPNYITDEWYGWLGKEYTISLRDLAEYSGPIKASPYSTKSTLRMSIHYNHPEELRVFETIPSQMEISTHSTSYLGFRDYDIYFEKDITGGGVEDLFIRFKYVVPWWYLISLTMVILGAVTFIIIVGINPLMKWYARRHGILKGTLWIVSGILFLFLLSSLGASGAIAIIELHIVFLFNPFFGFNQYGWIGFGVWLGIWIAIAALAVFPLARKLKKRKKALAWEFEDQSKELKEQLGRGAITQEEYEEKRKKLLEKTEA